MRNSHWRNCDGYDSLESMKLENLIFKARSHFFIRTAELSSGHIRFIYAQNGLKCNTPFQPN